LSPCPARSAGEIRWFPLTDQLSINRGQPGEILFLGKQVGLEGLQPAGQRRPTLRDLFGTDQPERRILREALGIVYILIACYPTVDGLAQQVGQRKLCVLPAP
jgi:hypothetical protein